jgi:hypothetical protein
MITRGSSVWSAFLVAALMVAIPMVYAQTPGDFATEPDKSMANAHESFVKGDMNKAAEHIQKAAAYVKKESGKVAKDSKDGVMKAGDQLSKLGGEVKKGAVKSPDELKKTFAQVDHSRPRSRPRNRARMRPTGSKRRAPAWRALPSGLATNCRTVRRPQSTVSRRPAR